MTPSATRERSSSPPRRSKSTRPKRAKATAKTKVSASDLRLAPAAIARGRQALERFATFFALIPTPEGKRQKVEPFQRLILLLYFAGIRHVLVLIPKGNGKTSLLAALAIFHMLTTRMPRVYIGASTVDQADTIYNECVRIVKLRRAWRDRLIPRPGYRAIHARGRTGKGEPERGLLRILASDKLGKGSLEGIDPTLGIVEELHAHVNDALYAAIHGGLGKRNGQMVSISTAGADEESLLGLIRAKAQEMVHKVTRGALRIVRSAGSEFAMLEWSIGDKAEPTDVEVVKDANPASFVTQDWLRETFEDPGMTPTRWKRYHCGLWAAVEGRWIEPTDYDANGVDGLEIPAGELVVLGYDHARSFDHAALVVLRPTAGTDGDFVPLEEYKPDEHKGGSGDLLRVNFWVPGEEDGGRVAYWKVKQAMRDACERWTVAGIGFDKLGGFSQSAEELADEGLPMIEVSMNSATWAPLTAELFAAINSGRWRHDGDPQLRSHVIAGEEKESPQGPRLHGKTKGKVDGLMASGCAWYTAFFTEALKARGSVYQDNDLLVLE